MTDGHVSEAAVKLLEARIGEVAERLRLLAAERSRLREELEALRHELDSFRDDGRRKDDELRSVLADALAALGEE